MYKPEAILQWKRSTSETKISMEQSDQVLQFAKQFKNWTVFPLQLCSKKKIKKCRFNQVRPWTVQLLKTVRGFGFQK